MEFQYNLPDKPYEISFKLMANRNNGITLSFGDAYVATNRSGQINLDGVNPTSPNFGDTYRIQVYDDVIQLYDEDALIASKSKAITGDNCSIGSGSDRSATIKDFKIIML